MIIKKVNSTSLAKLMGALYALFGLIVGLFTSIISLFTDLPVEGPFGGGPLSIVTFPILYGIMGFVGGVITGMLYNFVASKVGGIEIEVEETMVQG